MSPRLFSASFTLCWRSQVCPIRLRKVVLSISSPIICPFFVVLYFDFVMKYSLSISTASLSSSILIECKPYLSSSADKVPLLSLSYREKILLISALSILALCARGLITSSILMLNVFLASKLAVSLNALTKSYLTIMPVLVGSRCLTTAAIAGLVS